MSRDVAKPSLAPARVSWSRTDGPQEAERSRLNRFFSSPRRKLSPSIMGLGRASPGMQGQLCLQEGFHTSPLPTLNPPPWYLLVSEIKLLLPLGHPLEGDPLLCPSLCRAEIGDGSRMVPVGAGGTPAAPPQGTMSHQPQHKFGGDLGTHLCSSAATTKPQDANSVQTEEYKVLEGRWEQRGQDRSEWGHRGPSHPCPSPVTERLPGRGRR